MPQGHGDRYIRRRRLRFQPWLGVGAAVLHRQPAGGGARASGSSGRSAGRSIRYTTKPYARRPARRGEALRLTRRRCTCRRRSHRGRADRLSPDRGTMTLDLKHLDRQRRPAATVDLREEFESSGVKEVLAELDRDADRPGAGQEAHPRDRGAAAGRAGAPAHGSRPRDADPAHELHRQSRHRQDHRRAPHGRPAAPPRLHPQGPSRLGHPRRPGRPVYRPHRAEDQGDPEEGDGRRAVHRRGLLPLPAGERARLRPGGDRDPAAGDGEPARRPGRHPRRLRRAHGPLLREQPRLPLAHRPPHRLSRLHGRGAAGDRRADARPAELPPRHGGARGDGRLHRRAAARSRTSPMRARSAMRSTAPG